MLSFSTAQAEAWIGALIWPFLRVLALFSSAPILGERTVPARLRVGLALLVALLIAPGVAAVPAAPLLSAQSLLLVAQQLLVGLGLGLAMRVVFAAVELTGDMLGLQMGIGFATFFDPSTRTQTPIVGSLLSIVAMLVFLALDGPLVMLAALADSFQSVPPGAGLAASVGWERLGALGAQMFAFGLQLSLPLLTTMLVCNLALGVMARAAPQLNLFSVGFPVTLLTGFGLLAVMLGYMAAPLEALLLGGLRALR